MGSSSIVSKEERWFIKSMYRLSIVEQAYNQE